MSKQNNKNKKSATYPAVSRDRLAGLPGWFTNRRLQAWVIFAFAGLLYANTLGHDYAQDDAIVITDNMFTMEGMKGIPGILRYDTFYGFFKEEGKANLVAGGRYRPLSLVTFAIEVELFGKNPLLSHLVNVLLYSVICVVLYLLLQEWFRPSEDNAYAYFVALAGALIFAAHPLHTEVVANIKGRDELLALLGSLGGLLLTFYAFRRRRPLLNLVAGLVFLLGLFSKENAITFLAVVPLAFFFFTRAGLGTIIRQTAPFLAATAIFLIVRGSVLGWSIGEPSGELMNNPFLKIEGGRYVPFSGAEKLATVIFTLGKYIQLLLAPYPLTHDYYPRQIGVMTWADASVWLSLLLYLCLGGYALWSMRRRDAVSFGILYFLATVSIVSNLFFAVGTNMSERLVFMPSVGYALVMGVLLFRLARTWAPHRRLTEFRQLYSAVGLTALLVLTYGLLTVARNPAWHDNFTLFSTDIATSPNSAKLQNALGGELITQSIGVTDETRRKQMLQEAIGHLQEAVRIHPNYKNAYLLLGNAYYYLQQWDQAILYYRQALALDPDYRDARNNLGITYRDAGRFAGEQQGDVERAIQYLEQAYQLRPDEYETVRLLGVAYGIRGDSQQAIRFFTRAVELAPDNADALYNLGNAYYQAGQPEEGEKYHQRAKVLDPKVGTGDGH